MIRNYLDVCLELPWNKKTRERVSVEAAREGAGQGPLWPGEGEGAHPGVRWPCKQLAPELKGQMICLVGPPGVGKTSIAMSMARAHES